MAWGGREVRIGFAIIAALLSISALFPRGAVSRGLFSDVGPSLDAGSMSRPQCLRAAMGFGILGGVGLLTAFAVAALQLPGGQAPFDVPALAAVLFTYMILSVMGLFGAVYLLLRAPFRPTVLEREQRVAPGA